MGGAAHWAAGQEDPAIWGVITGSTSTTVPPPVTNPTTPAPADYLIGGPNELTLRAGGSTSGQYALTPVNGFTGTAQVRLQMLTPFAGTVTASASMVAGGSPITLNVSAPLTTTPGTYQVSVKFVSGTTTHEQVVAITVQPP